MKQRDQLRIAIPRGALFEGTLDLLDGLDLDTSKLRSDSRKLFFEDIGSIGMVLVSIVTVRPSDVPTYVEYGAAHLGITGKDVLMEQSQRELYEFVDLDYGCCKMVYATPVAGDLSQQAQRRLGVTRIATKYPQITDRYFKKTGRQVEIIEVRGSVELAPLAGLADGIVDLTATGSTLSANSLEVREEIASCSARLIANAVAHKLMSALVDEVAVRARQWRDEVRQSAS